VHYGIHIERLLLLFIPKQLRLLLCRALIGSTTTQLYSTPEVCAAAQSLIDIHVTIGHDEIPLDAMPIKVGCCLLACLLACLLVQRTTQFHSLFGLVAFADAPFMLIGNKTADFPSFSLL
jgi:hypothetical protein